MWCTTIFDIDDEEGKLCEKTRHLAVITGIQKSGKKTEPTTLMEETGTGERASGMAGSGGGEAEEEIERTPVNWVALDALVLDYAKSERLLLDHDNGAHSPSTSTTSCCSSSSSFNSSSSSNCIRGVIEATRKLIEEGSIDQVFSLLSLHAPAVLDDQHLVFRLQKQRFIELLRSEKGESHDLAINCCRTALGPCALNAYPEAYEEFRRVLLAFIYDKDDQTSPVAEEWSKERRSELAALVASTMKARLRAYDPCFSQTLKYLLSVHNGFCYRQSFTSTISHISKKLLSEERDPPATLQEPLYEAPQFKEVDVQALAHAVGLPRQGAIDSLRYTDGDLFAAFQNELSRMKLNVPMVDELVHEYCLYKGLIYCTLNSSSDWQVSLKPKIKDSCCREAFSSLDVNRSVVQQVDVQTAAGDAMMEDFTRTCSDGSQRQHIDVELRIPSGTAYSGEACSTSGACQTENPGICSGRLNNWMQEERGSRPRWRGRSFESKTEGEIQLYCTKEEECARLADSKGYGVDRFQIVLEMRELVTKGMIVKVVHEIKEWNPHFFEQNPILLFQLKQVEFLKLVEDGNYAGALRVARSDLGPLAASYQNLLKPLKETLLALARPEESASVKRIPLNIVATSLQIALGASIGIEEPLLMKIMRATLYTHAQWFKLQMCTDRFEKLLRISELKELDPGMVTTSKSQPNPDICSGATSHVTGNSCNSNPSAGSNQPPEASGGLFNETAILHVMEILALPRSDAIQLLAQYDGSADAVFQQIFN